MAKLKRNIEQYSRAGILLDQLCKERQWSFARLSRESMTPPTTLIRASAGRRIPSPETIEKWCQALHCSVQERNNLFHAFGLATPEEKRGEE